LTSVLPAGPHQDAVGGDPAALERAPQQVPLGVLADDGQERRAGAEAADVDGRVGGAARHVPALVTETIGTGASRQRRPVVPAR
jgi:hypothetical protein